MKRSTMLLISLSLKMPQSARPSAFRDIAAWHG
jgi:hypothetical protein